MDRQTARGDGVGCDEASSWNADLRLSIRQHGRVCWSAPKGVAWLSGINGFLNDKRLNDEKSMRFEHAITRFPGQTFSHGLTSSGEGSPSIEKARDQHERYCDALRTCGVTVDLLAAALEYPDSTFVEDTAILTAGLAIIM